MKSNNEKVRRRVETVTEQIKANFEARGSVFTVEFEGINDSASAVSAYAGFQPSSPRDFPAGSAEGRGKCF